MKSLSSVTKMVVVPFLSLLLVAACTPVQQPVVAPNSYYTMTPYGKTHAVYTPVNNASYVTGPCCGTQHVITTSSNYYRVGSYPVHRYYSSPSMPVYGTYYYKTN